MKKFTMEDTFSAMVIDLISKDMQIEVLKEELELQAIQISLLEGLVDFMKDKLVNAHEQTVKA